MGNNDDEPDEMEQDTFEVLQMKAHLADLNIRLEEAKKDRDMYRDQRNGAKRAYGIVASVALCFLLAGTYLITTADATDDVRDQCAGAPHFTAPNQSLNLGETDCGIETDSAATLILGFMFVTTGTVMTTVTAIVTLSRIGRN